MVWIDYLLISLTSVLFTAVFILVNDEFAKFIITYEVVTNIFGSSYLILTIFNIFMISAFSNMEIMNLVEMMPIPNFYKLGRNVILLGIGGGIIYFSVEWAYYVEIPQFGFEPFLKILSHGYSLRPFH